MTNLPPNPPPGSNPEERPEISGTRRRRSRRLKILGITGTALLTLGIVGYIGVGLWVRRNLPGLLEQRLEALINRDVEIGEVTGFSLIQVEFAPSAIPPTETNPDYLKVESIKLHIEPLPLIISRTLRLDMTLMRPNLYIAQDEEGGWLDLEITSEGGELPFEIDAEIGLRNADIILLPNTTERPLEIALDGQLNVLDTREENQLLRYEAIAAVAQQGRVKITGETVIETGKTEATVQSNELPLNELNPFIANLPLVITDGTLSGNVQVELASFQEIPSLFGTARLDEVEAQVAALDQPITVDGPLRLRNQAIALEAVTGQLGEELVAQFNGEIDLDDGFDVQATVQPFSLETVFEVADVESPIEATGQVQATLQVQGPLSQPVLTGSLDTVQTVQIDEVAFENIEAEFRTDFSQFVLSSLQANPVVGGEITGEGTLEFAADPDAEEAGNPLSFDIQAQLPADELAALYGFETPNLRIGTVNAQGQIRGTLANPLAQLNFRLPNTYASAVGDVSGSGQLVLNDQTLLLQDTQLAVGGGTLNAQAQYNLETTQLQALLQASNINLSQIDALEQTTLVSQISGPGATRRLDARLDLSGTLEPLLDSEQTTAIVTVNELVAQLGEQFVRADGVIRLDQTASEQQPLQVSTQLDVEARSNLGGLPRSLLARQTQNFDIAGLANFSGQLTAQNLLNNPFAPGNLDLQGNLRLQDFVLNNVDFDSVLAGPVSLEPGEAIALDLRGTAGRDQITAQLAPCELQNCVAPYLPTSFTLRRVRPGGVVLAQGQRVGNILDVDLQNFSLGLLGLTPAAQAGIAGPLTGEVTGDLSLNLSTLAAQGSVQVERPAIGFLGAETFAANFVYADGQVRLDAGSLALGQSLYNLQGAFNLNTGAINANIDVAQGYVQDLLALAGWFSVSDLRRGLAAPIYADPSTVQSVSVGRPQSSLAQQLRLFFQVLAQLQQRVIEQDVPGLPTDLDIRGTYTGDVAIAGTLSNPTVAFDILGDNWLWYAEPSYSEWIAAGYVPGREREPVIALDTVVAQGQYANGALVLNPVRLDLVGEAYAAVEGRLGNQQATGSFVVDNLPLAVVRNFVNIPLDVTGEVNVAGQVGGSLGNLLVQGEAALDEIVLNQELLRPILGTFRYADARLQFDTTEDSLITAQASIPLPPEPGVNDELTVAVNLDTDAIALVGPLTNDRISWVNGEAAAQFQARANLGLNGGGLDGLTASGDIVFADATVRSELLEDNLTLNGIVNLQDNQLQVPSLVGQFAQGEFLVAGVLPLTLPASGIDNPLTLSIAEQDFDIEGLYDGEVASNVVVTGSLLYPVVGGQIRLQEGEVSIPDFGSEDVEVDPEEPDQVELAVDEGLEDDPDSTPEAIAIVTDDEPAFGGLGGWVPYFDNFQVQLGDDFGLDNFPLYSIRLEGDLALNGPLNNLQPDGIIEVERARVDLLSSQFYLTRGRSHTITFLPDRSILNPQLDVQLQTVVYEDFGIRRQAVADAEIREDIIPNIRPQEITVLLNVEGAASELLPSDRAAIANYCQIEQPSLGNFGDQIAPPAALERLSDCVRVAAFAGDADDSQILSSPVVTLTSTPERTDSELVALLGSQFLTFAEDIEDVLQSEDESEVLLFGVNQYVVQPIFRGFLRDVDNSVSEFGQNLGLTDLTVFPLLRATRQVGDESVVEFLYDYEYEQVRLLYRTRF